MNERVQKVFQKTHQQTTETQKASSQEPTLKMVNLQENFEAAKMFEYEDLKNCDKQRQLGAICGQGKLAFKTGWR